MQRFLVTTADERTWPKDRPILFLGEWCRLYNRRHVWSKLDAIVADPYGVEIEQKTRDKAYLQALGDEMLDELTSALNKFHCTKHSVRYWNIVLGHWLQRYIAVAFNRYYTIKAALEKYEVSGSMIFDLTRYSLATDDTLTFIWACSDDLWNYAFYSKILDFLGNLRLETDYGFQPGRGCFVKENEKNSQIVTLKKYIRNAAETILAVCSRKNDAFIANSFLSPIEEVKLQIRLGQCPQLWQGQAPKYVSLDKDVRSSFSVDVKKYVGFERFVRLHLNDVIPVCYLEGYSQLVRQGSVVSWPSKPRLIFTSNNFQSDEVFKVWTASKVEDGVPYFVGQHGNNYGTLLESPKWPELTTCDRFFTWGWSDEDSKCIPAFNFKTSGRGRLNWTADGGLLLIELHPPHRFGPDDSYFEFGNYQKEQFRFVSALPTVIRKKLIVRLHSSYKEYSWCSEQRWRDFDKDVQIEDGTVEIWKSVALNRLIVHSYDSTGILETLSLNVPTLCFWREGDNHLQRSAKPYYKLLRDAGIIADTPEAAAEMVRLNWDGICEWWFSGKIQEARQIFCDRYSKIERYPAKRMKQLLIEYSDQRGA